jgi:glycosyltransferase involved in cell wall biosynthesis
MHGVIDRKFIDDIDVDQSKGKEQSLRIAFITSIDAQDKGAWSGIFYCVAVTLQKYCGEVNFLGPSHTDENGVGKKLKRIFRDALKNAFRRYFVYDYHIMKARKYANRANKLLATGNYDVIVAPTSITEVAFLKTSIPIVLVEDATFALLHNYYSQYTNLGQRTVRQLHRITRKAIQNSRLLIYSSTWAAQSAIKDYHADPEKVCVIPMGANFEKAPSKEFIHTRSKSERCRLIFVGVDWERKGGEIAFETLLKLEEMGIDAELVIVGCIPPKSFSHERMKVIGFIDKNDEKQYHELENLYLNSDFLLLPTRSECYGIVFCEANAYGLPVISTDTGGVSEIVHNGVNGFLLPTSARGAEYAQVIAELYQDEDRYTKLVKSSRNEFDKRLNWDAWGMAVRDKLVAILNTEKSFFSYTSKN